MRMELARIIDPRHDRDTEVVMAEIAAIHEVFVRAIGEIVGAGEKTLDTNAAAMAYSATAAQEGGQDAETHDTQAAGDAEAAGGKRKKRTRSQVPL